MKTRLPEFDEDEVDLTPMIDCVFQLILFFMLTSSFIEEAKVYKISLPKSDKPLTVAREKTDSVTVTVNGELYYRDVAGERRLENVEALMQKLSKRTGADRERPVIIRCDARCEYRQFMQVKNALKLAGVETIFEEVEVRSGQAKP